MNSVLRDEWPNARVPGDIVVVWPSVAGSDHEPTRFALTRALQHARCRRASRLRVGRDRFRSATCT